MCERAKLGPPSGVFLCFLTGFSLCYFLFKIHLSLSLERPSTCSQPESGLPELTPQPPNLVQVIPDARRQPPATLPPICQEKQKKRKKKTDTPCTLASCWPLLDAFPLFFSFSFLLVFFFVLFFGHGQRAGEGVRPASPPDRHWKPRRPTKSERRRKASKSIQLGTERKEDKRWEKTDTNVSKPLFSEAAFSFFYFFCHGVL